MEAQKIILEPIMTEKSYAGIPNKVYTFKVALSANKVEIKKAVEDIFGVQVQVYVYGDDTYLEAAIADVEAMYPGVTITAEKVDKAEADCIGSVE